MNHLGITRSELEQSGGYWTAREIEQQPAVWVDIERQLARDSGGLRSFLDPLLARSDLRIVLTGAGTSAFIGECLAPCLTRAGLSAQAVATTDFVGSPESWVDPALPTLLVSFGRSGNSPESMAALDLAGRALPRCHHLIITCNEDGALYRHGRQSRNAHAILLPERLNDRGFAMTSSFSGMLLAAALGFGLLPGVTGAALEAWGRHMLDAVMPLAATLAATGFDRVVYLGSNECKGLAREAALKMLELSDGRVVTLAETPLGFRHGPKTVVDARTLVILFLSNDPYTSAYEIDLLDELRLDNVAGRVIALSGGGGARAGGRAAPETAPSADHVRLPGAVDASSLGLCFPYVVFAQTLAFLQSRALGLRPDVPNARGVVNRVVPGFAIHPWNFPR